MKPLLSKLGKLLTIVKEENTDEDEKQEVKTEKNNIKKIKKDYSARNEVVNTFEIKGRGWGHSVGMSQNGAIGMANNDFSCEEIIKWYYRGVEVE